MAGENNISYEVVAVRKEADGISTIELKSPDKKVPAYSAGQYVTIYFPETGTPEGKAYTLSSAPVEKRFAITVKAIGEFSSRLCAMRPGDVVHGSLPYGYFGTESDDTPLCMIAGGVGITPFRSITFQSLTKNPLRKMDLFYSCKKLSEAAFRAELDLLAKKHKNFRIHYFITREDTGMKEISRERVNAGKIRSVVELPEKTEFLLCGSIPFTRDIWRGLRAEGVPEENILTEAFFSH